MPIEEKIMRVQRTHRKLRKLLLQRIFDEFDGELMELAEEGRRAKYAKMGASSFSFFRGSAYLFYFDTSREWFPYHTPDAYPTWIQGDLHFENFGVFQSELGRLVYDVNDFDEGYMGSYLFDILRMSVSIALVARQLGLGGEDEHQAITAYTDAYVKQIRRFARRKDDPRTLVFDKEHATGPIRKLLKKAEKRAASQFLEGVTMLTRDERTFVRSEELLVLSAEERRQLDEAWPDYLATIEPDALRPASSYAIKDAAVKHGSGTASIGLDRYYVLIEGEGGEQSPEDRVIEVKEVRIPVPAYFMPYHEPFWERFAHQGKRVTVTQQMMHHEADPFLGYLSMGDRQFYVRERSPYKKKLKLEKLAGAEELVEVLDCMGRITAKLHARADADMAHSLIEYHSEDEIAKAIGEDEQSFSAFVARWASAYAYQVEADYELFTEWVQERSVQA
ncbi:DUF2252 domain-containing protein [Paenibacillus sp. YYML68]|uniref:DUF2252 domain-containing protein n=1 Tax=Paenibacillus sp. YYML68 TaxID=2909250 RepID=UPI0037CB591D